MIDLQLTRSVFGVASVHEHEFLGEYAPRDSEGIEISDSRILAALRNPLGTAPISELAAGAKKVLIITDDQTRETPLDKLLPPVLQELQRAGITDSQITFLIGLGTHRPMTQNEIDRKFGSSIAGQYQIVNHAWDDPNQMVSLRQCSCGFPVMANKLVTESDLVLSVGSIVPHATTGYSGGTKTLMTGVSGPQTIENTHWMALDYPMKDILGKFDNPVRQVMAEMSRKVNLKFILNAILDRNGKLCDLVAGDPLKAHRAGAQIASQVYGVRVGQTANTVLAEAHPMDSNLRQSIKAVCSADIICEDGGVIILAAECKEGISRQFPDFQRYGFRNPDALYEEVVQGRFSQKLLAYTLVAIGRIIQNRVTGILVSPHISESEATHMGFRWASDLSSAIEKARDRLAEDLRLAVLRQASILLPILAKN